MLPASRAKTLIGFPTVSASRSSSDLSRNRQTTKRQFPASIRDRPTASIASRLGNYEPTPDQADLVLAQPLCRLSKLGSFALLLAIRRAPSRISVRERLPSLNPPGIRSTAHRGGNLLPVLSESSCAKILPCGSII